MSMDDFDLDFGVPLYGLSNGTGKATENPFAEGLKTYFQKIKEENQVRLEAWNKLLKRLEVRGGIPVKYTATIPISSIGLVEITATATVPAVAPLDLFNIITGIPETWSTGTPVPIAVKKMAPRELHLEGDKAMLAWVAEMTLTIYIHELGEQMFLSDEQPYNPHDPAKVDDLVKALKLKGPV